MLRAGGAGRVREFLLTDLCLVSPRSWIRAQKYQHCSGTLAPPERGLPSIQHTLGGPRHVLDPAWEHPRFFLPPAGQGFPTGWGRIRFLLWVLTTLELVLHLRTLIRSQVWLVRKEVEKGLGKGGVSIAKRRRCWGEGMTDPGRSSSVLSAGSGAC